MSSAVPAWNELDAIERVHGDAFYLVDLSRFAASFHELRDAFRAHYPRTQIAYSYKTNYLPRICGLVDALGGYAEVVSRMEYEMARRAGVAASRIIVNGPVKTADDLQLACGEGAVVNLDQPYQLDLVAALRVAARVGLRVNFDIGGPQPSRFGFDTGEELRSAIARLRSMSHVRLVGLHAHFALPNRAPDAYARVARIMISLARDLFPDTPPEYLDVGGGYYSKMAPELAAQFGGSVPSFADYAAAIAPELAAAYPAAGPELILEPGVALAATAVRFVTRVLDLREIRGHGFAQVTGSFQTIKGSPNRFNLPVHVVRAPGPRPRSPARPFDVVGYTCMEGDVLYRGLLADVAPGDYLVFENCGAYTTVQKPPFIRAAPAMLALASDRTVEVLRRRETVADVLATYAE